MNRTILSIQSKYQPYLIEIWIKLINNILRIIIIDLGNKFRADPIKSSIITLKKAMLHQNPQLAKKTSSYKKKIHIHFDEKEDFPTQESDKGLITDVIKRQNKLLSEERHQRIVKKPKKNDPFEYEGHQSIQISYGKRADSVKKISKDISKKNQESLMLLERKTLELLKELLFHPNRNNKNIINCEIANKWIFDNNTPTKLKSFLILYMILYQFESIQFRFKRKHLPNAKEDHRIISIEKIQKKIQSALFDDPVYHNYKQNEMQKYLSEYLEWLISQHYDSFEVGDKNIEFWAMALNNCEQVASQLIQNKNPRDRHRNVFLSLFLMNAEDFIFRSTIQTPSTQKILIYMVKQDLELLPKCHWILGLNISVRYFFNRNFEDRVRASLNPNNIEESQIDEFYHEYQLLCNYFDQPMSNKNIDQRQSTNKSLTDWVIEWIGLESGCASKNTEKNASNSQKLDSQICQSLLLKAVLNSKNQQNVKDYLLMAIELLERQNFLSIDQKNQIISDILYKNQCMASKLGKRFPNIINNLERIRQTQMPKFFQLLTSQYNSLYKHLLQSRQPALQNNLLAQLKHLIDIDIAMQDLQIKKRIRTIVSSFNLISHWNKEVLKNFVVLLERYHQQMYQYKTNQHPTIARIEQQNSKSTEVKEDNSDKELKEVRTLSMILKMHLKLQPLNLKNLVCVIQFVKGIVENIKETKQSTIIPFEPRTIRFIKKDILSILFSKNGFNQSLLSEIKKFSITQEKINIKVGEVNLPEKYNILDELQNLSQRNEYFQGQIQLLKQEASLMTKNN